MAILGLLCELFLTAKLVEMGTGNDEIVAAVMLVDRAVLENPGTTDSVLTNDSEDLVACKPRSETVVDVRVERAEVLCLPVVLMDDHDGEGMYEYHYRDV